MLGIKDVYYRVFSLGWTGNGTGLPKWKAGRDGKWFLKGRTPLKCDPPRGFWGGESNGRVLHL